MTIIYFLGIVFIAYTFIKIMKLLDNIQKLSSKIKDLENKML